MTPRLSADEIRALVRDGRVDRRVYADPDLFALEMERIFGRVWLYVAHESQLRRAGDFVLARMGRHEMIVVRDGAGHIHALHNSCAHRGARIAAVESGSCRTLVCPYHGWSYRLDGALEAVPHRESYPDSFDLADPANHLPRAPRVESYRGFVFASLAAEGPSLTEHLGAMTEAIDNLVDRAPEGEIELAGGSFRLVYPGNWKLHMENANDTFHPGFVHESSVATARRHHGRGPALDDDQTRMMLMANGFSRREWEGVALTGLPQGHSYMGGFYKSGILAPRQGDAVSERYRAALAARHGERRADEILGVDRFNNLIYPNLSLNAQYHQLRVVEPLAVDRTVIAGYCFRLKGAPEEIFHRAVRFLSTLNSPASMIFSDDIEIFARCHAGLADQSLGSVNVERGHGRDAPDAHGRLSGAASELPVRAQFGAWLGHMTAEGV